MSSLSCVTVKKGQRIHLYPCEDVRTFLGQSLQLQLSQAQSPVAQEQDPFAAVLQTQTMIEVKYEVCIRS